MELHDSRPVDYGWHIMMMIMFLVVFAGEEQSIGSKGDIQLHYDMGPMIGPHTPDNLGLRTPPRILKLDEELFPTEAAEEAKEEERKSCESNSAKKSLSVSFRNGYVQVTPDQLKWVLQSNCARKNFTGKPFEYHNWKGHAFIVMASWLLLWNC